MKKLNLAILVFASIFFFACSGNTENKEENAETSENKTKEQTEIVEEIVEDAETIEETSAQAQILKIEEIKKGDIIEGLTVTKVEYIKGDMFAINFEGEISVKGILQINEMEETLDFFIEESIPTTKIVAENEEYILYNILAFNNPEKLKKALSKAQLQSLNTGEAVNLTIKAKNPLIGQRFSNGRLGIAGVEFLELQ